MARSRRIPQLDPRFKRRMLFPPARQHIEQLLEEEWEYIANLIAEANAIFSEGDEFAADQEPTQFYLR